MISIRPTAWLFCSWASSQARRQIQAQGSITDPFVTLYFVGDWRIIAGFCLDSLLSSKWLRAKTRRAVVRRPGESTPRSRKITPVFSAASDIYAWFAAAK